MHESEVNVSTQQRILVNIDSDLLEGVGLARHFLIVLEVG